MVIAGKIRGNAPQLASYLLAQGENERITILDVDGHSYADAAHLKDTLYSMELNSELTRSRNSVYHAYINPNPEDTTDRAMSMEEWQQSVEILTKQLGYEDQRRVVVLHEKPGNRIHAHIVYERYNHERRAMTTYEQNYKAHDRARAEMERKFSHKPTPQKNNNRAGHKQTLTAIWQRTDTAAAFMSEAKANGYQIAMGTDRPFKVIDSDGVSFDLVRKLDGIKTSEVRQRFSDTKLVSEKQAIREQQQVKQQQPKQEQLKTTEQPAEKAAAGSDQTPAAGDTPSDARQQFLQNIKDVRERNRSLTTEITLSVLIALKVCFSFKGSTTEKRAWLKDAFAVTTHQITERQCKSPPKVMLGFIEAAQYYKPT
ncbi:MAG: hypothetical protein BGO48_05255 [Mucilaginibacter sp. 44-25]|nr:MAG: hypothetical protein BGO48_05255 [Mucilaginibacter sp. 44-25]